MALSQRQQQIVDRASADGVLRHATSLTSHWANREWLPSRNKYLLDPAGRIDKDERALRPVIHAQIGQYVAGSSIVHCFDGWSYLGRALDANLAGDPDTARHLGYYAELRAAMSLLATGGVGVFKNKHVIVSRDGRCEILRAGGTHDFTWQALQYWAGRPSGTGAVLNAIQPGGLPLSEWLSQFSAGVNFLATKWLLQWGLDLSRLSEDRNARNIASYRPTAFTSPGPRSISDTLDSVCDFWEMCDPGAAGGFPILDRYLLRRSIEIAFRSAHAHKRTRRQATKMYERQVQSMMNSVTPTDLTSERWERFLNYTDLDTTPRIISDASRSDSPSSLNHSQQVISRAALLLRVATGAVSSLIEQVVTVGNELDFWWHTPAVRRRMWPADNPPDRFTDLWADVADARNVTKDWLDDVGNAASHHQLWAEAAPAAATLATSERVALWGLRI